MNKRILIINKCLTCHEEFAPKPGNVKKGNGRYCSYICARNGNWANREYKNHMRRAHKPLKENIDKLILYMKSEKGRMETSKRMKGKRSSQDFRIMGLKGAKSLGLKKPTSIEKKLYEELKNRDLLFETQKLINERFLVDAYIPSLNLIIEADGDYWHNLDRIIKKDRAENAYLVKCGFNILRLTESEINDGTFKERLVT